MSKHPHSRITQQKKKELKQRELPENEEGEEREAEEEGMKEQWSNEERAAATLTETELLLPVRNVRQAEVVGLVEREGDHEIAESVAILWFLCYPQRGKTRPKMRFFFCLFALSSVTEKSGLDPSDRVYQKFKLTGPAQPLTSALQRLIFY